MLPGHQKPEFTRTQQCGHYRSTTLRRLMVSIPIAIAIPIFRRTACLDLIASGRGAWFNPDVFFHETGYSGTHGAHKFFSIVPKHQNKINCPENLPIHGHDLWDNQPIINLFVFAPAEFSFQLFIESQHQPDTIPAAGRSAVSLNRIESEMICSCV